MSAQKTSQVFVYGSLMCHEVLRTLLGRVPKYVHGSVHGYHRYCIRDRSYPAVAKEAKGTVAGMVLQEMTAPEMDIFDEFEDDGYERVKVRVSTVSPKEVVEAEMYLWATSKAILYGEWSYERDYLPNRPEYLVMCRQFIDEYHRELRARTQDKDLEDR